jgi:coenzyme F420-reducing hydrogenase delta subunit
MTKTFQPRIVAFLCSWCSYAGADRAGTARLALPASVRVVRLPCSGRLEPELVLETLADGAEGIVTLACHPGDCHYRDGNSRALQRQIMLEQLLQQLGVEPERLVFDYVSSHEGERFTEIIRSAVETIRALGPLKRQYKEESSNGD